MNVTQFLQNLDDGAYNSLFHRLYKKSDIAQQTARYKNAANAFAAQFPDRGGCEISVFSAPGRTEIGGNHTDHQHGCVLAASISLDVIAFVHFHDEPVIRLKSEGHPMNVVDLTDLSVHDGERGTSDALIRGVCFGFSEIGVKISGFDAYTTSDVLSGSGMSSSAAFEILIGTIINAHDNGGKAAPADLAKIGQFAENVYFGKKSGLLDQMACAVGGIVSIDFADTDNPAVKQCGFDFSENGYRICITDTKGSHADLIDDYSSIPAEMCSVAEQFGKRYLREVDPDEFYSSIPSLREKCSDRAILRAIHFFGENERAVGESDALAANDVEKFFGLVKESGESSAMLLQNLYSIKKPYNQEIPLAIELSRRVLNGSGAVRVHGGGFAGTIQAFVPENLTEKYRAAMEGLFGAGSCYVLKIRPIGGIEILTEE